MLSAQSLTAGLDPTNCDLELTTKKVPGSQNQVGRLTGRARPCHALFSTVRGSSAALDVGRWQCPSQPPRSPPNSCQTLTPRELGADWTPFSLFFEAAGPAVGALDLSSAASLGSGKVSRM